MKRHCTQKAGFHADNPKQLRLSYLAGKSSIKASKEYKWPKFGFNLTGLAFVITYYVTIFKKICPRNLNQLCVGIKYDLKKSSPRWSLGFPTFRGLHFNIGDRLTRPLSAS